MANTKAPEIKKNILVIGETGVGKSSMINVVLGKDEATISDSALRGTFDFKKYDYQNYHLVDTIGFNDVEEKNAPESLKNLGKFAMKTKDEGIVLIIYIMKKPRITKASRKNYEYFVKTFCEEKVPVLLVVTHCELDAPGTNWYLEEKQNFETMDMIFTDAVCGCSVDVTNPKVDKDMVPGLKKKRARTQKAVRDKIEELALQEPWKPSNWKVWIVAIFLGVMAFGITLAVLVAFFSGPGEMLATTAVVLDAASKLK